MKRFIGAEVDGQFDARVGGQQPEKGDLIVKAGGGNDGHFIATFDGYHRCIASSLGRTTPPGLVSAAEAPGSWWTVWPQLPGRWLAGCGSDRTTVLPAGKNSVDNPSDVVTKGLGRKALSLVIQPIQQAPLQLLVAQNPGYLAHCVVNVIVG